MKKTLSTLALALTLTFASTNANAGIMMLLGSFTGNGAVPAGIVLIIFGGPAGIVISEDERVGQIEGQLMQVEGLKMIDNQVVFAKLADAIDAKYKASGVKEGKVLLSLDEATVRNALKGASLTEEQKLSVVNLMK